MNIAAPSLAVPAAAPAPRNPARLRRSLTVGVIGPGHVGRALLAQLRAAQPRLAAGALDLHVGGIAASRRMWLDCDDPLLDHAGCDPRERRAQTWRPTSLAEFAQHIRGDDERPALLVDCSASDAVADRYAAWLAAGIHVVTANKLAGSGPLPRWQAVRREAGARAQYRQEATVCAGLPVLGTLHDLLATGDELRAVDGMLSGSLAWLLNHHDGARPFSALVREAQARGYTEPDPRTDLSGRDVARKLVILARSAGWPLSVEDVQIQELVPDELAALPLDAFVACLEELDAPLDALLHRARAEGGVLRHVAHLEKGGAARVTLAAVPPTHAFAHARQCDNVLQFTTTRYCDNPLTVQGPGAGPEVTAAGVFADVLRIAESLPLQP